MTVFEAFILGLIQGLAEFLPISSSGHLALAQNLFGLETHENILLFDIMLHVGTLTAVCIILRKDVSELILTVCKLFTRRGRAELGKDSSARLMILLILATVPLIPASLLKDQIETLMGKPVVIGFMLMLTGAVLKLTDLCKNGKKTDKNASVTDVLTVGLMQALALVPGLSRSGMTISGGLFRGFDRKFAFRLSFLMSIPAILGATVLEIGDALAGDFDTALAAPILVGTVTAAVFGCIALVAVGRLIMTKHFSKFAWYCLIVGAAAVFAGILNG